jgi:hypothetical protein
MHYFFLIKGHECHVSNCNIMLSFSYICGSVHHQSRLSNNQRYAALSSRIYSSLQGYSTCFGCCLHPSSRVQLKL